MVFLFPFPLKILAQSEAWNSTGVMFIAPHLAEELHEFVRLLVAFQNDIAAHVMHVEIVEEEREAAQVFDVLDAAERRRLRKIY